MSLQADAIRAAYARGYRVDEHGSIRSHTGRILKPYINPKRPYPRVSFRLPGYGNYKFDLHRFVAFQRFGEAAFEPGIEARHMDGNASNCRPSNIELGTRTDNERDKPIATRRRSALAAAKSRRRLTDAQIRELAVLTLQGVSGNELARRFGVSPSTISEIRSGKLYSEVTGFTQRPRTKNSVPAHLVVKDERRAS